MKFLIFFVLAVVAVQDIAGQRYYPDNLRQWQSYIPRPVSNPEGSESKNVETKADGGFITANLNEYIDNITPAIVNFIVNNEMDPMEIPDMTEGFSVKPLFIEYHGELELTEGQLHNLRSIKRSGNMTVAYLNRLLRIRGDMGVKDLKFDYEYLAKIMNIGPTGGVLGSCTKASFVVDILIDFNSNEIHLQEFDMHDVGKISVKLTGNPLTDWMSNSVIKVITTLFKNVILKIVEINMKNALQDKINEINNAIGGAPGFIEKVMFNTK